MKLAGLGALFVLIGSAFGQQEAGGCANPPTVLVTEDSETVFAVSLAGSGINENCLFPISAGTQWLLDLTLETIEGAHDMLLVSGSLTHASPIPGVGAGSAIPIELTIDAGELAEGNQVIPFDVEVNHGSHRDLVSGTVSLDIFVEQIFDFHFIFDYDVELSALHTAAVPALPPWCLGFLALAVCAWGARTAARKTTATRSR